MPVDRVTTVLNRPLDNEKAIQLAAHIALPSEARKEFDAGLALINERRSEAVTIAMKRLFGSTLLAERFGYATERFPTNLLTMIVYRFHFKQDDELWKAFQKLVDCS
jgi:hypothetical protein